MPWLIGAALLLLLAAAAMPFDKTTAAVVRAFSHRVGRLHAVQDALQLVRTFGKAEVIGLIALAIGWRGCRRRALQIVVALVLVTAIVWPFKLVVGRERPNRSNNASFPSGDVATMAAACVPLAQASPWVGAAAMLGTAGVAAGRIYDGRHYPADTLAGAAFGLLAGAFAIPIVSRLRRLPPRRGFLIAAGVLFLYPLGWLPQSRGTPYLFTFLVIWGPLAALLLIAHAARLGDRPARRWTEASAQADWRRLLLLLALMSLAHYTLLASASTLWDRDEPRFSRATVEMVRSGDYLVPTFNGALRPDKPALIYWLMSLPVRAFGPGELTCRAVAPLAALLTALLTAWVGRRLAGARVGLLAGAFLVTTPLLAVSGTAATTDALLLLCITATVAVFLQGWQDGFRWAHGAGMALGFGAALLTKGPVGMVVPLLAMAALMAVTRRGGPVSVRAALPWVLGALAIGIAFFLAWGLPANSATHGEFLRRGLGHHVVDRSVTPLESHGGRWWLFVFYYVPLIVLTFFPWTLYLLPALRAGGVAAPAAAARRLALAWGLPVIVLMSLVATKLPHYVLPAWPALAILAALGAVRLMSTPSAAGDERPPWITAARVLFASTGVLLGAGLAVAPWFLPVPALRIPAVSVGLLMLAMTSLALWHHRRGRHTAVIITLIAGMSLVVLTAALRLLPAIETVKVSPPLAAALRAHATPGTPVTTCGYGEPSLIFYLNAGPVESIEEGALREWAARPGRGLLAMTEPKWERQRDSVRGRPLRILEAVSGFNYSQGKWVKVLVILREGAPHEVAAP